MSSLGYGATVEEACGLLYENGKGSVLRYVAEQMSENVGMIEREYVWDTG